LLRPSSRNARRKHRIKLQLYPFHSLFSIFHFPKKNETRARCSIIPRMNLCVTLH
jgi:hypothetical protein